MDLQKIEPLLMDYALGATTPEVTALVEAYQEKDADMRALLKQWQGVANAARQAFGEKKPKPLPNFPLQQLRTARRTTQWHHAAKWALALAACLMVGYLAGGLKNDRFTPPTLSNKTAQPISTEAADAPVAAVADFWSQKRLREFAQRNSARPAKSQSRLFSDPANLFHQLGG